MAFTNYDYLVEFVVTDLDRLKKLKSMREELDFKNVKERHLFFRKFRNLVIGWKDHLPDLRDIFKPEEMDWMLSMSVDTEKFPEASDQTVIIDFVVRTGYQDEPNLDKEGNPILRRNTPVHYVFRNLNFYLDNGVTLIQELFKIYNYFYVNYVSDDDWTHFHVASSLRFDDVVQNFLTYGHDPNQPGNFFNCPPLFCAIEGDHKKIVQLLLEYGADPNLSGKDGLTPLHSICREDYEDKLRLEMFEILVKDCRLKHLPDNLGRTPLQLALLNRVPEMIDPLLDHGADLSSFVFPSEEDFNESIKDLKDYQAWDRLEAACGTLAAVERLENRGYNLQPRDALRIKTFLEVVLQFWESENDESWRYDEAFEVEAKMLPIKQGDPSYTLHDLTRFPFKEPEPPLTYEDYIDLACDEIFENMPENIVDACMAYLFERMSDGFYRQWGFRWS